jgi:hypothetical protein
LVQILDDDLARSYEVFGMTPEEMVDYGVALMAQMRPLREGVRERMAILD